MGVVNNLNLLILIFMDFMLTKSFMKKIEGYIKDKRMAKDSSTQKEHREVANQCWEIVIKEFPSLTNFFE